MLDADLLEREGAHEVAEIVRGWTRREFLSASAAAALLFTIAGCTKKDIDDFFDRISHRPTRRDISTMSANDPTVATYRDAVAAMKQLPGTDKRNWLRQAAIHASFCPHGNWLFLPWHREYLLRFERICRRLTGVTDFALPYWNWQQSRQIPAMFWGNSSNPLFDSTRTIGPAGTVNGNVFSAGNIQTILDLSSFSLFASNSILASDAQTANARKGQFESGPHDTAHGNVGGNMGVVGLSPRDPIFWCHHNMIECMWVEWNVTYRHPNTNSAAWADRRFTEFVDGDGSSVDESVSIGLLYPLLAYQFAVPAGSIGK